MMGGLMLSCVVFVFLVVWRSWGVSNSRKAISESVGSVERATTSDRLDEWTNMFIYGAFGLIVAMVIFELFSPAVSRELSSSIGSIAARGSDWKIKADGNCLFRAIAHHEKGDQDRYKEVKEELGEYLKGRLEDGESEVVRTLRGAGKAGERILEASKGVLSEEGEWGSEPEIALAAERYGATITVIGPDGNQIGDDYNPGRKKHWFLYWVRGGFGKSGAGVHYEAEPPSAPPPSSI